jgi:hypothetical protein
MFEIDDEEDESDHGELPCRQYHKSVDLSKAQVGAA